MCVYMVSCYGLYIPPHTQSSHDRLQIQHDPDRDKEVTENGWLTEWMNEWMGFC